MAARSIVRWIKILFDRPSAKKAEGELAASMGAAGKKGGESFLREARAAFDRRLSELKNLLAKGLINHAEFKRQADLAARTFNTSILAGMEKARAAGKLTDAEYLKLSRTLKRVGDEGASTWDRIKAGIVRAGTALVVAFGIRGGIRFAFSAIQEFISSEKVWRELSGTVDAAGVSFAGLEKRVRAAAAAFQDATVHSDEDYANSLQRLIAITGDVEGSIRNMTLVADVAARFFGGDLAAATDAVAKGMNTGVVTINRMKFTLDDLAKRSAKGAVEATQTLAGKIQQLNNQWGEFKEAIGEVLTGGQGAISVLDSLTGSVKAMVKWVSDNKLELQRWASEGIATAIAGMRTLLGLTRTFLQLRGKLSLTAGAEAFTPAKTAKGIEAQQKALEKQRLDEAVKLARIRAEIAALENEDVPQKLKELNQSKLGRLHDDLQESVDLLQQIDDNAEIAKAALVDLATPPPTGKGKPGPLSPEAIEAAKENAKTLLDLRALVQKTELALVGEHQREFEEMTRSFWGRIKKLQGDALAEGIDLLAKAQANLLIKQSGIFDEAGEDKLPQQIDDVGIKAGSAIPPIQEMTRELFIQKSVALAAAQGMGALADQTAKLAGQQWDNANNFSTPWTEALGKIGDDAGKISGLFGQLADIWAEGGIKGLAKMAKFKVLEMVASAIESAANAFKAFASMNFWSGAQYTLAAAKFTASAIQWGKIAGGGGAAGAGGASATGGVGSNAPNLSRSENMQPPGPEVHLYFRGPKAFSPEMEKFVYGNLQSAEQRFGKNGTYHIHKDG